MLINDLEKAKSILLNNDVLAIPTETVYGMAGLIDSQKALQKIFSVKERPFFDPLIVHIDNTEKAKTMVSHWPTAAQVLTDKFWPGPLTVILPKADHINPLITSGLDSVGLRCPNHPMTLELLASLPSGVAAPSANKFGKTSPTRAADVEEEFNSAVSVLDGGPCDIGIESTVCGIFENEIIIYRPGSITATQIQECIDKNGLKLKVSYGQSPVAPGQIKHHYMPKTPIAIIKNKNQLGEGELSKYNTHIELKINPSPQIAARELYQSFRELSEKAELIFIQWQDYLDTDNFAGVKNRLLKASTYKLN